MRVAIVTLLAAIAASVGAGAAAAEYHGQVHIDYRYTSGGNTTPGSPADVEQTAHLTLTVSRGRIVRMHGVVGLDYKWINTGCPNFTVETIGGGSVDAKPVGDGFAFIDNGRWVAPSHGHYVLPEPAVPSAPVTVMTTVPDNDCNTIRQTSRQTFGIAYVPEMPGTLQTPKRVVGTVTRTYQGYDDCHAFGPGPPPPPVGVSCTWKLRWSLSR
jgi:hypothetical protein